MLPTIEVEDIIQITLTHQPQYRLTIGTKPQRTLITPKYRQARTNHAVLLIPAILPMRYSNTIISNRILPFAQEMET
jgi:hypothetical protein